MPLPDLPNYAFLLDYYRNYANPKAKISREVKNGNLIRLKRDLYLNRNSFDRGIPLELVANRLYGPSYVSFERALRYYGLIPEEVPGITSAGFNKRRSKCFITSIGTFFYQDIPQSVYSQGVVLISAGSWRYLSATAEKALCDKLYKIPGIRSKKELIALLFDDLRIDEEEFNNLDKAELCRLAVLYKSTTLDCLRMYLGA